MPMQVEERTSPQDAQRRVTVLGIGNTIMGDDGLGVVALHALEGRVPPGVRLVDGGLFGLDLIAEVEGTTHLLVLDAVEAGRPPGSLVRLEGEAVPAYFSAKLSPHQIGIADVLALARLRGNAPQVVVVLGVQPARVEPSTELSPEVERAIPGLVEEALSTVISWLGEPSPGRNDAV